MISAKEALFEAEEYIEKNEKASSSTPLLEFAPYFADVIMNSKNKKEIDYYISLYRRCS